MQHLSLPDMSRLPLKIWRGVYALTLLFAYPWTRVRPWFRARREPDYAQRTGERFGRVPADIPRQPIWFHAVSAGEAIAAAGLIESLAEEHPRLEFLVTSTTPAGSAQIRRLLSDKLANVSHCYAPFDFAHAVTRFYDRVAPRLLVLLETELWPNMIATARRRGVPVLLVNGRLSARSARGYHRISALTCDMLAGMRFLACQSHEHAERFLALGAPSDRVSVCGNLKFDVSLPPEHKEEVARLRQSWSLAGRFVWTAGSTHEGEDAVVLTAHRKLLADTPDALLILAPRHPARGDEVAQLVHESGFSCVRRSERGEVTAQTQVLLIDTLGELILFYGLSQAAFLGGSLVSVGGHNPIEAAICAQPLLMGPHSFNFPEVVAAFVDAGCLTLTADAAAIAGELQCYFADENLRREKGETARQVVLENRGALARLQQLLRSEILAISPPNAL